MKLLSCVKAWKLSWLTQSNLKQNIAQLGHLMGGLMETRQDLWAKSIRKVHGRFSGFFRKDHKCTVCIYLCQNDDAEHGKESNNDKERHTGAFPRTPCPLFASLFRWLRSNLLLRRIIWIHSSGVLTVADFVLSHTHTHRHFSIDFSFFFLFSVTTKKNSRKLVSLRGRSVFMFAQV